MSLEGERDQAIEQSRKGQPTRLPQLCVHANRGETRNRVDLIEIQDAAVAGEEKIDARHARAVDGFKRGEGQRSYLGRLRVGQRCRNQEPRSLVDVLGLEIVELTRRDDLARDRGLALVLS